MPFRVMDSPTYVFASPRAKALLWDLARQFNGYNNGDLSAAWGIVHQRGWTSRDQLGKALAELVDRGLIVKTRQGGRNRPSLYALTWLGIDECRNKLDFHIKPSVVPGNEWRTWCPPDGNKSLTRHNGIADPGGGPMDAGSHDGAVALTRVAGQSC